MRSRAGALPGSPRSQNSPVMIARPSRATWASRCSSGACCEHAGIGVRHPDRRQTRARRRSSRWAASRRGWAGSPGARRWCARSTPPPSAPRGGRDRAAWRAISSSSRLPHLHPARSRARSRCVRIAGTNVAPVAADDEAHLQCALARGGIALTGLVGVAGAKREHLERVPAEDALGRRQARLAPVGVDRGPVRLAAARCRRARARTDSRNRRRAQRRHEDPAARVDHRRDRVGQHVPGIGEQPAPVARVVRALAQVDARSKLSAPREPRKIVGRSERRRGPSEAISTSARKRCRARFAQSAAGRASRSPRPSRTATSR